jgi:hypothetical protein
VNVNLQLLSDLARKSLKGDHNSYRLLMKVLNEVNHPILDDIDRRVSGVGVLDAVLTPLSLLVIDNPKPKISSSAIIWQTGAGAPHSVDGPAELWFRDMYIAYSINGKRHREDGPAVIDVSNEQISYFLKGEPRTHDRGPFRVERHEGNIMLTYVLSEKTIRRNPDFYVDDEPGIYTDDKVLTSYDEDHNSSVQAGSHIVVTREYVDIEGLGKSTPTDEDVRNLRVWSKNFEKTMMESRRYLEDFLEKFR